MADSGVVKSGFFCIFVSFFRLDEGPEASHRETTKANSKKRLMMYEYKGLHDVMFIAFLLWRVETLEELTGEENMETETRIQD